MSDLPHYLGVRGEKAARSWLSRHGYQYIPVSRLMWEDSRIDYPSLSQGCSLRDEYRYAKDDMGFVRNGVVFSCWEIKLRYEADIRKTGRFFKRRGDQETPVKALMNEAGDIRWELNYPYPYHTHTAMFPDLLARMPELTFVEVKANQSKLEPRQKLFLKLARMRGFNTKIAYVSLGARAKVELIAVE